MSTLKSTWKLLRSRDTEVLAHRQRIPYRSLWPFGIRSALLHAQFFILLACCVMALSASAQTRWQQFQGLSGPMKCWTVAHPFAAVKAQGISARALALIDSVKRVGCIGTDYNGGELDAFRHGIWMALLVQEMPAWKARSLGRAYERGNRRDFRRGRLEDGSVQDAVAREMDLLNNQVGCRIGKTNRGSGDAILVARVIKGILAWEFCRVFKDAKGNSLDVNCHLIPEQLWQGRWKNARCLQRSGDLPCI